MSLLDCVCCCKHGLRTATCWDSLDECSPSFLTYSCLVERANEVCDALRTIRCPRLPDVISQALEPAPGPSIDARSTPPIAIYSRSCPEVIYALMGVMASSAPYLPLDLGQPSASRWYSLLSCGVRTLLIELSLFNDFLSEVNSHSFNCFLKFHDSLLHIGLVICNVQWKDQVESHDSNVIKPISKENDVTEEFYSVLKNYYQEIDLHCSLCSCERATKSSTKEMLQTPKNSRHIISCASTDHNNPFPSLHSASIAYWLHTTGTTGEPKLVQVPHCCVVPNIVDLRMRFAISQDDVIFNAAPLTFDPSVVEIFLALSSGACLLVVPTKIKRSPHTLSRVLFDRQFVSVLQVTPALIRQLPESEIVSHLLGPESHMRVLAFGGEACPTFDILARWKSPENNTAIFNIYGITEVSSWATCYQVTADDLADTALCCGTSSSLPVPLGSPLLGTQMELRDVSGASINSGSGFIWIGGTYRSCLVGDECQLTPEVMRPSGDIGHFDDHGRLFYDGRCDRQIKRFGHRIHLDHIQQTIDKLDMVATCTVIALTHTSIPRLDFLLVAYLVLKETSLKIADDRKSSVFAKVKELLPNHSLPDHIEIVEQLPINDHVFNFKHASLKNWEKRGRSVQWTVDEAAWCELQLLLSYILYAGKVDIKRLEQLYHSHNQTLLATSSTNVNSLTIDNIKVLLKSCAEKLLGLKMWSEDQNILELGATSFDVVRLASYLEDELKRFSLSTSGRSNAKTNELIEYLLEKPLSQVAVYVYSMYGGKKAELEDDLQEIGQSELGKYYRSASSSIPTVQKRSSVTVSVHHEPPPKKPRKVDKVLEEITSWRRGQCFINGRFQDNIILCQNMSTLPLDWSQLACTFETRWKVNTGKCVDASPLLVQNKSHDQQEKVYIGSHSGRFFSICFRTGRVHWMAQLTDRIESSACLSICGQFVTVGCYDGCVFTLFSDSGAVHWYIKPGGSTEPVKSSPCVDPITGLVWLGSHDHHIYALDIYEKKVVHCVYPGGGSCFSSPCLDSDKRILYCATLQGNVTAVNLDSGDVVWTYKCPKPVFSSPVLLTSRGSIVVGCVDGGVYVIGSNGQQVAILNTGDAVFSSSCVVSFNRQTNIRHVTTPELETKLYCGSHDKHIYCWNENLQLEWKSQQFDSEIYSIPFVAQTSIKSALTSYNVPILIVATTSGSIYSLNPDNGQVLGMFTLPMDVFSSPVVYDNHIVTGCRDDYVYCFQLNLNSN